MLTVSELTSMELACWQIEDTVKQLREAGGREKKRLLDEQERLQQFVLFPLSVSFKSKVQTDQEHSCSERRQLRKKLKISM